MTSPSQNLAVASSAATPTTPAAPGSSGTTGNPGPLATPAPAIPVLALGRKTPHYHSGIVGGLLGLAAVAVFAIADSSSVDRPVSKVWAGFYIPFLVAIAYYIVTEHDLETRDYEPDFSTALSDKWQVREYAFRVFLAFYFSLVIAIPFGLVPASLRTPALHAPFYCINELEFRLSLLVLGHLLLLVWDVMVLLVQDPKYQPDKSKNEYKCLVRPGTILGDIAGGWAGFFALWLLGRAADTSAVDVDDRAVAGVIGIYALAYWAPLSRVIVVIIDVTSAICRVLFGANWPAPQWKPLGPVWTIERSQMVAFVGALAVSLALVLSVMKSFNQWPFG